MNNTDFLHVSLKTHKVDNGRVEQSPSLTGNVETFVYSRNASILDASGKKGQLGINEQTGKAARKRQTRDMSGQKHIH